MSVRAYCRPTSPDRAAATPAGAFHTPRALSVVDARHEAAGRPKFRLVAGERIGRQHPREVIGGIGGVRRRRDAGGGAAAQRRADGAGSVEAREARRPRRIDDVESAPPRAIVLQDLDRRRVGLARDAKQVECDSVQQVHPTGRVRSEDEFEISIRRRHEDRAVQSVRQRRGRRGRGGLSRWDDAGVRGGVDETDIVGIAVDHAHHIFCVSGGDGEVGEALDDGPAEPDLQSEAAGIGGRRGDRDRDGVAPKPRAGGEKGEAAADASGARSGAGGGRRARSRGQRSVPNQTDDVSLLAAIGEKLIDGVAEVNAIVGVEPAEPGLKLRPALHQARLTGRTLRGPADESRDGRRDASDRMSAGKLFDIDAGIGEASGHGQRSFALFGAEPTRGRVLGRLGRV